MVRHHTLLRITEAANPVTAALANLAAETSTHDARLADIRGRIAAENPRRCFPPSPADGYVTTNNSAVIVGETTIHPVDGEQLAEHAVRAATDETITIKPPTLTTTRIQPAESYWRHSDHGGLFTGQRYLENARGAGRGEHGGPRPGRWAGWISASSQPEAVWASASVDAHCTASWVYR